MKWLFLIAAVLALPPLTVWLRRHPRQGPKIWTLFGFLAFNHGPLHLYMALVSWPGWPGHAKGIELSLVDLLAVALYFSLPRVRVALPFRLAMFFYFFAAALSTAQAELLTPALFYPWQLVRLFLVYVVVAKASAIDERVAPNVLRGMAFGLFLHTGFALWERVGHGIVQAGGLFSHQNLLGMLSHFVLFPYFALLLSGGSGRLPAAVTAAGSLLAVLTGSRATVGLDAAGCLLIFLTSGLRRWTSRKGWIGAIGGAGLAILVPFAMFSFEARFAREQSLALDTNYDERAALEVAASRMLSDHPMGVGTNLFTLIANTRGYYARAGVAWGSWGALVHNVYRLVAAETGYLGLLAFIILFIQPLAVALRCGWRNLGDGRGDVLFGLGMALLMVYLHSLYEWIFISFEVEYIFATSIGIVAGLAFRLGYWRRPQIRAAVPLRSRSVGGEKVAAPMKESPSNQ